MKLIHLFGMLGTVGFMACSQDETLLDAVQHGSQSQSIEDSLSLYVNKQKVQKKATRVYYPTDDEYYSSNMYEIRELPLYLKARGNGTSENLYLTSTGMRAPLALTSSPSYASQFYLKEFSAVTGIPYMNYNKKTAYG